MKVHLLLQFPLPHVPVFLVEVGNYWLKNSVSILVTLATGFVYADNCTFYDLVSFPDPTFKLDKGLAHFARNLGLPDLASKE